MVVNTGEDHWSAKAYQNSASFVPKLASKVIGWLDVQPGDVILDIGCGDGIINLQIAEALAKGAGSIHGVDSSADMIAAAKASAAAAGPSIEKICTFEVLDATQLVHTPSLQTARHDKVFSNAAMHWVLATTAGKQRDFFRGVHGALKAGGTFVFEMGGMGNVAEMRTALLATVGRRVGIERARAADPWFFPDEAWMKAALELEGQFRVERIEREYRPTRADTGGIEGWMRLMGKQFFDIVGEEGSPEREECIKEVGDVLKTVCASPGGGDWMGYVRLRAVATKL